MNELIERLKAIRRGAESVGWVEDCLTADEAIVVLEQSAAENASLRAELDALKLRLKDKILIRRIMAEELRDYYQVEAQQYIDWHRPEKAESYLADAALLTAQLYQGDSAEWLAKLDQEKDV